MYKYVLEIINMQKLMGIVYILNLIGKSTQQIGKTYIQKGIYLLQEGFKEDLNYNYKIHFYGPYSQELANQIDILNDFEWIDIHYLNEDKGYEITLTKNGERLLKDFKGKLKINYENINKVNHLVGGAKVKEMELLSTVLYFSKILKNRKDIIEKVITLKPHFNKPQINRAIKKLEDANVPIFH